MRHVTARNINDGWSFHLGDLAPDSVWSRRDAAAWTPVTLPHSWNALDTMEVEPSGHYTRAFGWYTRRIAPPMPGERLWLECEAASQRASIWLNGRRVAEHEGGYTAFTLELLPEAEQQADMLELALRVDNLPNPDLIPSDLSDFFLYGGLTRNAWCYTTGPRRLASLRCHTSVTPEAATLSISGQIDAPPPGELDVEVRVFSPQHVLLTTLELALVSNEAFTFPACVISDPKPWSPEQPALYTLQVTLWQGEEAWDTITERVGLRDIDFPAYGQFTLNGQPLTLHGTHRHEDWAGHGSAVPDELTRQEMRQIKAAGFNFVRLGHYPQAPAVLEACDELGLLVWEELPWCRGGIGGPLFRKRALAMFVEMVEQHFNHPSIVFWGLGNELDWESEHPASTDEQVCEFLRVLHQLSKRLDPQRFTALRRFEPGSGIVDVYSPSIWSGWYRGRYEDYQLALNDAQARYPRLLHIEWGGDSHYGRHSAGEHLFAIIEQESDHAERPGIATSSDGWPRGSRDSDWSESYMLDLMEWHLQVQLRTPRLAGNAQWVFKDFGTPLRPENPIPYVNQKGLVDRAGRPKELYYLFQSYLSRVPMCHIEAPTWPIRVGQPDEAQRVRVYSNCPRITLFVNGADCGERLRDDTIFPAAGLVWHVLLQPGHNEMRALATASDGQRIEHTLALEYSDIPADPTTCQWYQKPITLPDGRSGTRVTLQLTDARGLPVVNNRQRVTFALQGSGELLACLGTVDGSRVVELANGRASIVVLTITSATLLARWGEMTFTIEVS